MGELDSQQPLDLVRRLSRDDVIGVAHPALAALVAVAERVVEARVGEVHGVPRNVPGMFVRGGGEDEDEEGVPHKCSHNHC